MSEFYSGSLTIGQDPNFNRLVAFCLDAFDRGESIPDTTQLASQRATELYANSERRETLGEVAMALTAALELKDIIVPDSLEGYI